MITPKQDDYIERMCELNYQQWKAKEFLKGIPSFTDEFIELTMSSGYEAMTGIDLQDIYNTDERCEEVFWLLPYEIREAIRETVKADWYTKKCIKFLHPYVWDNLQFHIAGLTNWWNKCYELVSLKRSVDSYNLTAEEAMNLVVEDQMYCGTDSYGSETINAKMKFLGERLKWTKSELKSWQQRAKHINDVTPEHK